MPYQNERQLRRNRPWKNHYSGVFYILIDLFYRDAATCTQRWPDREGKSGIEKKAVFRGLLNFAPDLNIKTSTYDTREQATRGYIRSRLCRTPDGQESGKYGLR